MVLRLAGRPNFAVTSGRFNPIQCPFKQYRISNSLPVTVMKKEQTEELKITTT